MASIVSISARASENPLLEKWKGPYGGVPPFDKVQVPLFKPAVLTGMKEALSEVDAIANNPEAPTFANTFLAMQNAGEKLSRVNTLYGVWSGGLSTPDMQKTETALAPKFSAHGDKIVQNEKLFKRIEAIYKGEEFKKLNPEQQRLVTIVHDRFVLNGARLNKKKKADLAKLNQELSLLSTQFGQNLLKDEEDYLLISDVSELKGLPQAMIDSAAEEAVRVKQKGKWVIANTRSSIEPLLTYSPNRALREKAFKKWASRGENKNKNNNLKIVTKILELRTKRAKILGFPTHAHWSLADTMAKDPEAAMGLMLKVWKPAVEQVKADVKEMQALVDAEKGGFKIEPWDYRYYAEKVRVAKYDIDFNLVKPYLRLENIRKAMFFVAGEIFDLNFELVKDVPVFHPTMSVYKVTDKNKNYVGLWYFDPYARPGKRSGAWMSDYREQSRIKTEEVKPIVSNNSNFVPGDGENTEISWDDALTMFHEFGHAIHGLASNVTYPSLSGTNVPRDYVEFPSQVYENWLMTPEVMAFLKDKNGKVIPKELVKKIEKAKYFNTGFKTVEFLGSAIVDMELHLATKKIDPAKFEKETLERIGMPSEIVMRHRIPQFAHIFSGGYSAGYYSYLWSQVLDKDAYEAFTETKDPYNKKVAKKLKEYVFSKGNTMDPNEAYRLFRGRDPSVDALLRANGFATQEVRTLSSD